MKNRTYTLLISLVAAFGGLLFGFDIAVFAGIVPFIQPFYELTDVQLGWTGSSLYIGCIIGSLIAGSITDHFGRKFPLIAAAIIFTISYIFMGWSGSYSSLIIWRIIAGISVGGASILSPLYIAEVSPASTRGKMVSINQLTIVIGILIAYITNYLLASADNNWRWMFTAGAVPSCVFLLFAFFVPESPRWLIIKGHEDKARRILDKLTDPESAEKEIGEIKSARTEIKGKFTDLFKKNVRYIILVGIILAVFQQISGANAVFFYAPMIFEKAGMSIRSQLLQQILIGSTNLIFTLVAMRLVDHLGRKKLMVGGSFMLAIWLLVIALFFHFRIFNGFGLTMFILLFIGTFAVSLAPVTWVLISEIFPARIRGTAMSIATAMLWVACFSLTFVFPVLFGSQNHEGLLSPTGNFLLFAGINFLYFLILLKAIPETRGKSLERIEHEFTNLKHIKNDKSLA